MCALPIEVWKIPCRAIVKNILAPALILARAQPKKLTIAATVINSPKNPTPAKLARSLRGAALLFKGVLELLKPTTSA